MSGSRDSVLGGRGRSDGVGSRGSSISPGVKSRAISVLFLRHRRRYWRVARHKLLVHMRELPARVLQEELAMDGVHRCKNIHEHDGEPRKDHSAVLVVKDRSVGNKELQFAHKP